MKKNIFILIIVLCGLRSYSQTLSNSTWEVYDTTNTFFIFAKFTSDTASYSLDNINYTNTATFEESGANFTIIDLLSDSGVCGNDIGEYTFLIQGDTLEFTPIIDLCTTRNTALSSYYWVNIITGISDIANNKSNLIKITNILGQETPYRRNTPLFYIYDDGTVEKRIVIE